MLQDHRILMDAVCHSQPQGWSSLVSAVQYLYYVSAQSVLGISAPLQVRFLAHLHQIVTELSQKSQNVAVA